MANENTKFINSLFLKNLIENELGKKDVMIKTYSVEAPSENGTLVTRASLNHVFVKYSAQGITEDVLTFVTKVKPTKGELSAEFKISADFMKEILVYKEILPAIHKTLKKIGERIDFTPK